MPTTAHCIIDTKGLQRMSFTVAADSTVAVHQDNDGWIGLLVDGNFWPLVMWKHTVGRPHLDAAVADALQQVRAEIDDLSAISAMDFGSFSELSTAQLSEEIAYREDRRATDAGTQLLAALRYELAQRKPLASAPVASAPVASAPVASAPVASAPVVIAYPVKCQQRPLRLSEVVELTRWAREPMASAPVASAPVASAPVASAPKHTFNQVRAMLANEARKHFTQEELVTRLRAAGVAGALPVTRQALAMRYAWVLLPGGQERVKGGRS